MNPRAIGYGIAGGVALVVLQLLIAFAAPLEKYPAIVRYVVSANQLLSILAYAIAGWIAGRVAQQRGAAHGFLAGLGTAIAGRLLLIGVIVLREGFDAANGLIGPPLQLALWLAMGAAIATGGGVLGAQFKKAD